MARRRRDTAARKKRGRHTEIGGHGGGERGQRAPDLTPAGGERGQRAPAATEREAIGGGERGQRAVRRERPVDGERGPRANDEDDRD